MSTLSGPALATDLYYERHGDGEPLVLLHGAFMDIESNWSALRGDLAQTHEVIAVELQGHGRTPDRNEPLSYEGMADDVAALLSDLEISSASIMGYSMGANVALQLAIRYPDSISSLVLISPSASDKGHAPEHKSMVQYLSADMFVGTPLIESYEALSPAPDFPTLVEKVKALELVQYDWMTDLRHIQAPSLIVAGDADVVTLDHLAELYLALGGSTHGDLNGVSRTQLSVLPSATHTGLFTNMDHVSTISQTVRRFLSDTQ
jgi:pimeloyl-ACP methyl ester carboxylesterase